MNALLKLLEKLKIFPEKQKNHKDLDRALTKFIDS